MDALTIQIEPALTSAVAKAIATLTAILDDAAAPAAQKIRAACTILRISMSWPKHREALLADVPPPTPIPPHVAPPSRAVSSPERAIHTSAALIPRSAQSSRPPHAGQLDPSLPSLSARLEGLSTTLPASLPHTSRAASLFAAAGSIPSFAPTALARTG